MSNVIERIDVEIAKNNEFIDRAVSLDKLKKNKHFKKVFLDYYSKTAVININNNKANRELQDELNQKYFDAQLSGIGMFFQFIEEVEQYGAVAIEQNKQHEQEKQYYMEEELNG